MSLRIPPLTPRQGREYLAHRFAAAGASLERTLSAAAVGEILARCGGNPGRIDRLVDDCLALTARRRRRMVTPAVVRAARQPIPRRSGRLSSPVICALLGATGGVLAAGAGLGLAAHDWTPAFLAPSDGGAAGPAGASLPAATPEGPDAALFAGAGRFGTPSSLDSAPAPHGAADRPAGPPGLVAAVPQPAAPPPPAPPARIALAPVPVVPRPVPATLPALPVVPRIAAPEMAAVTARPLPLDPAPVAPALATPDAPPRLAAPLLASAAPVVIRAGGSAGVPDLAPPVLPLPAAWPAQPRIAEAPAASAPRAVADAAQAGAPVSGAAVPPSGEPLASPSSAAVPPAATGSPKAAVPRYDGAVVLHAARARDTASVLLRRIWGQDDAMVEALFRSLNPAIDARGPWPAGTMVTVPQRTRRTRGDAAPLARPRTEQARVELPTPPAPPRPDAIRDNPAGQVQSSVPYFCRSILPQNGAEDAYTRQVCGR